MLLTRQEVNADARGELQNIAVVPFGSILVITSKKGTIRGEHHHRSEGHYSWLASGRMKYYERAIGTTGPLAVVTVGPNEVVYSAPDTEHAFRYLEDSVMYVVTTRQRDQATYEGDLVRLPGLVPKEDA